MAAGIYWSSAANEIAYIVEHSGCSLLLVEGEAASALLRAAQQHEADLIVIGAIRDTSLAGRLLGTVASAVVREAPCEVLVVRPPAAWGDVTEIEVPEDV